MLILDEAHNAAPASGARYAVDSRLTRTVRDLAPRFEHRLFLSATPHNGHSNSFSALLEILDPQRFCRGVPVRSKKLRDAVMVRRLKKDLRGLEDDFPERKVVRVELGGLPEDSAELLLSRLLQQYRALKEKRLEGLSSTRRASAMLVVTSLQKRLLSSVEAFAHTLAVHRRGMVGQARQVLETGLLLDQPDMDDERAELTEEEVQAEEDAQVAAVTAMAAPGEEERALLDRMAEIAGSARYEPDSRIRWLKRWIEDNLIAGTSWRNRRVIIFTDYADSKRYLVEQLRGAIAHTERASERIDTFHGGMGEDRRESIKQAFNAAPEQHPLRILIATDAAREGVNLQNHCADLVHFDIPWNPSKMEQRNGRIDRKLQREKEVRCYYFVLPQRAEDRVLDVLVEKTGRIREELGSLSTVVERKVSSLLQQGIREEDAERLKQSLERLDLEQSHKVIQEELEESRQREDELKGQLETLHKVLKASRDYIGLDERHFLDSLSASLELLGTGGLKVVDEGRGSFEIPALHQRLGADPTWAVTLDSLRTPAKKGQKLWEWRKEAPLRRVVFHDPGTLDGELVHLHLEHRLVKRLLGRFMAQGFLHHQLSRGCVLRTEDPVPRVVVIGRLSLYGTDASRLHDEVIAVAAEWTDPQRRGRGKLKPLPEVGRDETLRLLEESLANPRLREVSATVRERLGESAPRDVEDLLAALEQRAAQLASRAEVALKRRGDQEAADMASILESQQKRILAERDRVDKERAQGLLGFMVEEIRQIEADARHWEARLRSLAAELETEPERIRATYRVKATRVEPVGLVYLWPVSG
ncbi:helicase [bacterium CPR1]|nr:helicase [bacterium CPR1]